MSNQPGSGPGGGSSGLTSACREKESDCSVNEPVDLPEAPRIMLKLEIGDTDVEFLYDYGSTYSMITRDTYESLRYKPPLTRVSKSGVTISGEKFQIEGVVFAKIKFKREDRSEFILEYEPILVSSQISSNLFGLHTDLQLKLQIAIMKMNLSHLSHALVAK